MEYGAIVSYTNLRRYQRGLPSGDNESGGTFILNNSKVEIPAVEAREGEVESAISVGIGDGSPESPEVKEESQSQGEEHSQLMQAHSWAIEFIACSASFSYSFMNENTEGS